MNPYTAVMTYTQPQSQARQMHQPVQQVQIVQSRHFNLVTIWFLCTTGRSITAIPLCATNSSSASTNTFQPLPYTPGLKQEDIMTITTTVALAFAKQLTPLFQQQPCGITATNVGQNCTIFTCMFCSQAGHRICDCNIAQTYITANRI
jgi:hypothetical protein